MSIARKILMGAAGAGSKTTYVDDVFSTYLYRGDGATSRSINNGVDNTEGGLVWSKSRNQIQTHILCDTERGYLKYLASDSNAAQTTESDPSIIVRGFTSTGYTIGGWNPINQSGQTFASWNFRKQKGFFDIVTWTGNGSTRTIAHNLGSVPGCIMVKNTSSAIDWAVWHRGAVESNATNTLCLNNTAASSTNSTYFDNGSTPPTKDNFTVHTSNRVNANGETYVAYVFAGGDSQNIDITNKTVTNLGGSFNASYPMSNINDGVAETSNATNIAYVSNADGMIDVYVDLTSAHVITSYNIAPQGSISSNEYYNIPTKFEIYGTNDTSSWTLITTSQVGYQGWRAGTYQHFPIPRTNGYRYWRIKVLENKNSDGTNGGGSSISEWKMDGYNASSKSLEYKFGENGDQNVIKCGSYVGNNNSGGPEINLGWEPQWIILKPTAGSENWFMADCLRGIVTGGNDMRLLPNTTHAEITNFDGISLTPTGFKITSSNELINPNGTGVVYIAIRRPDGYVGKPAEAGTDTFAMDTGAGTTTIPNFDGNFPVDFAIIATPGTAGQHRNTGARLTGPQYMRTNGNNAESGHAGFTFDCNAGWGSQGDGSNWQSWHWKRHAGFDVVTYSGNGVSGRQMPHGLSKSPEMMWVKRRNSNDDWIIYHKGLNGGTNPEDYYMVLNSTAAETNNVNRWNDTAPTSTNFILGNDGTVNSGGTTRYIAMLFASVDDISKLGYYNGTGYAGHVITTGFTPRLLIIKNITNANSWFMYDSLRGLGAGNDPYLQLENTNAQAGGDTFAISSTGFTINQSYSSVNASGSKYIYYAHA